MLFSFAPPTSAKDMIRYCENLARLFGDLAIFYSGPPVFEGKGNQRKFLILRYFSEKDSATSFDVSSDLKMSLTNASERLRRYCKQRLLNRRSLERRKRGRPTKIYKLTEAGQRRLAFLKENVKFRKAETYDSKRCRIRQLMMKKIVIDLSRRLASL
jgi:DNA-binding PadR family transcriptional regulator